MRSSEKPRVSVIIPTFNNLRYIDQTVASVMEQTYESYEIIVIDDGSTDDTASYFAGLDGPVCYVYQENEGVSAARNHGLRLARGKYVVFLDGDDLLLPNKIEKQVNFLDRHPKVDCVHSGWQLIDQNGEMLKTVEPWHDAPRLDLKTWLLWKPVFLGAMMTRRHCVVQAGGFDITLRQAEDVDLVFRMAMNGCLFAWLYYPTVRYRQHGESVMRNVKEQAESITRVLDKFFSGPTLTRRIRRQEPLVRYSTLVWVVWHLYRNGHVETIVTYLQESLKYSGYSPDITALHWLGKLAGWSFNEGKELDQLRVLWPHFKGALQLDGHYWQEIEDALNWWLDVWWLYVNRQYIKGREGLEKYRTLSYRQLVKVAQSSLVFTPFPISLDIISNLWRDLRDLKMIPESGKYDVTSLYLTLFGQSMLAHRWWEALKAFGLALSRGCHPKAIPAWYRFFRAALDYLFKNPRYKDHRGLASSQD